jgi:two-component sensor histidine kinase
MEHSRSGTIARLFERMLGRYRDADYIIQLKARFLLRICIAGIIIIPLFIAYTASLNLHSPVYNYSISIPVLAPIIALFVFVIIITIILIHGYYTAAAHLMFFIVQAAIWTVVLNDRSTQVGRLDTFMILIAFLSMSPLVFNRFSFLMPFYAVVTFVLVFLFVTSNAADMNLPRSAMWDFIADTGAASVIVAIISYNLFSINRLALSHSEETRTRLARSNEELNAANEELNATNEELESTLEELTATNEAFEEQNRELVKSQGIITESLEEKIVLMKEVHHRVKNNMQIVSSLLNLQSMGIDDPRVRQPIRDAVSRIHSMALIHEKIYRADNFTRINMAAYLTDLAREIIELHSQRPDEIRVTSHIEQVHLPVDQAIPCGILINEILTNSIKHGCGGPSGSRIEVGLACVEGTVTLTIADSGPGIDRGLLENGSRKTLGLQIIHALALQLGATVNCNVDSGTRFTICFAEKAV